MFFDKILMSDLIMSCQTVSDLVVWLRVLGKILTISWEIRWNYQNSWIFSI